MVQMQAIGGNVQARVGKPAVPAQARPVNTLNTAAKLLPALSSHIKRLATDEAIDLG